jgi:competence protein ComGC
VKPRKSSPFHSGLIAWMIFSLCVGTVLFIAMPNFIKARSAIAGNSCINNLRQADGATQQFALEKQKANASPIHSAQP